MSVTVNNSRTQDLTETFTSIIKMMLASIRAQGLRSLIHLPMLCLLAFELRRFAREFAAIMATIEAHILDAPEPEPAPLPDPSDQQAECAPSPEAPLLSARPRPAARDRQQPAEGPPLPAAVAAPDLARAADGADPTPALPHARRAAIRPSRRAPHPFAALGLSTVVIATGRSP